MATEHHRGPAAGRSTALGVVRALVQAVRAGDEERIRALLVQLAACADVADLYALRSALEHDLHQPRRGTPDGRARNGTDL